MHEEHRHQEECDRQHVGEQRVARSERHGKLDSKQSEQGGELDDRVHCHRRGVFEGIADGVSDHGCVVQGRSFLFHVDLYDLLCVVPCGAGICHEDGLVQAEDRNGEEIADKQKRLHECERKRGEEDGEKDVEHTLLRVLCADLNYLLAVTDRCLLRAFQVDVCLDERDRAVCAGGDRLCGSACEPEDHCPTADQPEHEWRVQQREVAHIQGVQSVGHGQDDGEGHGGCADDGGADEHRLCRGLECIAGPIIGFQHVFCAFELHVEVVVLVQLRCDAGDIFDQRQ